MKRKKDNALLEELVEYFTSAIEEAGELPFNGGSGDEWLNDLSNSLYDLLDNVREEDIDACGVYIGKKIAKSFHKVYDRNFTSRLSFDIIDEHFEDYFDDIGKEIYWNYEESFFTKDDKFSLDKCLKNKKFWKEIEESIYEYLEDVISYGTRSGFINFDTYDKKYFNYIKKKMIEKIDY